MRPASMLLSVVGFCEEHCFCFVLEPNVLKSFSLRHDSVIESDVGSALALLAYFKRCDCLIGYVQPVRVSFRSQKHVVVDARVDRLEEGSLQRDYSRAVRQLARPEILEPTLRGFDGV